MCLAARIRCLGGREATRKGPGWLSTQLRLTVRAGEVIGQQCATCHRECLPNTTHRCVTRSRGAQRGAARGAARCRGRRETAPSRCRCRAGPVARMAGRHTESRSRAAPGSASTLRSWLVTRPTTLTESSAPHRYRVKVMTRSQIVARRGEQICPMPRGERVRVTGPTPNGRPARSRLPGRPVSFLFGTWRPRAPHRPGIGLPRDHAVRGDDLTSTSGERVAGQRTDGS